MAHVAASGARGSERCAGPVWRQVAGAGGAREELGREEGEGGERERKL